MMRILFLCNFDVSNASMVTDHIMAFRNYSVADVLIHSNLVDRQGQLEDDLDLDAFDAIVIHYSIFIGVDAYLSPRSKFRISRARAVKVAFLQDEYRFVQNSTNGMIDCDVDIVFTCVPEHAIAQVYGAPELHNIKFVNTLTGYIPSILPQIAPKELTRRTYHVSYRGRQYPAWHGSMGREKFEVAEKFIDHAGQSGLNLNISTREDDRVYGAAWIDLIRNSWAVLGVESGASVFDFSGAISAKVESRAALLPKDTLSYDDLRQKYFADVENTIDLAQVSPRVFEAIALQTLCVLFEGSYSGLLQADVHYLMLKKDFSNIDHVLNRLKDPVYVSEIIANAYGDIAVNPNLSYRSFIRKFDAILAERVAAKGTLVANSAEMAAQLESRKLQWIESAYDAQSLSAIQLTDLQDYKFRTDLAAKTDASFREQFAKFDILEKFAKYTGFVQKPSLLRRVAKRILPNRLKNLVRRFVK